MDQAKWGMSSARKGAVATFPPLRQIKLKGRESYNFFVLYLHRFYEDSNRQ
jgi:hypothetical protein